MDSQQIPPTDSTPKNKLWLSIVLGIFFIAIFFLWNPPRILAFVNSVFGIPSNNILWKISIFLNPFVLGVLSGFFVQKNWRKIGIILGTAYTVLVYLLMFKPWEIFRYGATIWKPFVALGIREIAPVAAQTSLTFFVVFLLGFFLMKGFMHVREKMAKNVAITLGMLFLAFTLLGTAIVVQYNRTIVKISADKLDSSSYALRLINVGFDYNFPQEEAQKIIRSHGGIDRNPPWKIWHSSGSLNRILTEFPKIQNSRDREIIESKIEKEPGVKGVFVVR